MHRPEIGDQVKIDGTVYQIVSIEEDYSGTVKITYDAGGSPHEFGRKEFVVRRPFLPRFEGFIGVDYATEKGKEDDMKKKLNVTIEEVANGYTVKQSTLAGQVLHVAADAKALGALMVKLAEEAAKPEPCPHCPA